MAPPHDSPLLTDDDGYRYFIAELDAFKVIGENLDGLRRRIDPMMRAWFRLPDAAPSSPVGDESHVSKLPHGQVRVVVGEGRNAPTENQRRLFDWLREKQRRLVDEARLKLLTVYRDVRSEGVRLFGQAPWFSLQMPEIVRGDEIDATVRLTSVRLHPQADQIALVFQSLWEWEDYPDVAVSITNGKIDEGVGPAYQLGFP